MPHDNRVIVATVGQGGAEFRILVEKLLKSAPHELHGIQMWLNVAGLVRGASGPQAPNKIDKKINGFGYRLRGWPSDIAGYLSSANARLAIEPDFSGLTFVCVSMVGLPNILSAPVGIKGAFQSLGINGPNDGVAMFHESIVRPGYVVPVSGNEPPGRVGATWPVVEVSVTASLSKRTLFSIRRVVVVSKLTSKFFRILP
jgi:hypothetical protein